MKITGVRLRKLEGVLKYPGTFFEERRRNPTDIYAKFNSRSAETVSGAKAIGDGRYQIVQTFVQIDTDEGVTGIAGPIVGGSAPAFYVNTQLRPLLIGEDPLAHELLWDQMYRTAVNGRKGDNMIAISYVDIALWDIKGKWLGQPVYRLLGGPVQDKIPAYASASGCSLDPEKVRERVRGFASQGYCGTKWFIRQGPSDGPEGVRKNVELVAAIREAGGADMEIMIDAWNSWDIPYTLNMARLLEEYRVSWFEEPVMPDLCHSYARLREKCPIPIAGGEHECTRWGARMLMDMGAMDIYQPDPVWAGGISEVSKICTLASAYDVKAILHGCLVPVSAHVSFAQNSVVTPMMEYLVVRNEATQLFYKNPVKPVNGFISPPSAPGCGLDIDEDKIVSEKEILWTH